MLTGWDMWKETACCQTDSLKNATSLSRSFQWGSDILRFIWSMWEFFYSLSILGRQNSNQMDCPRSYSFPEVYLCQWCLELWNSDVGGCVLWGETLLGDDQSRRKYGTTPSSLEWNALFSESGDRKFFISHNDSCLKKWNTLLTLWFVLLLSK